MTTSTEEIQSELQVSTMDNWVVLRLDNIRILLDLDAARELADSLRSAVLFIKFSEARAEMDDQNTSTTVD